MKHEECLKRSIRRWIACFILCLVLSGFTASVPETGLSWILQWDPFPGTGLRHWLDLSYQAVSQMNARFPFLSYGYDWLAFGHLALAILFIGILVDPVRNIWLLQSGCVLCALVLPVAFIAGAIRGIPIGWRLIDCSFGLFGLIPLIIAYRKTRRLENLPFQELSNNTAHA